MSGRTNDGRSQPAQTLQQSPVYRALSKSIDDAALRTEAIYERLEKRLDRMDKDVQRTEIGQDRLSAELLEMRRDVGELRDATHMAASKAVQAAAVAVPAAASVTAAAIPKTWWARALAGAVGFTTIMVALNNVPDAARGWDRFWAFLANRDGHVVEAKQDTTSSK